MNSTKLTGAAVALAFVALMYAVSGFSRTGQVVVSGFSRTVAATPAQERKTVKLRTLSPGDVLYVLLGGGGNSLALIADSGVVLIDTKSPGWGDAIRDAVEAVTDQPVKTIVNTHAHVDHAGSNPEFPSATTIIAHPNAKAAMEKMEIFRGPGARMLPNRLVSDRYSLLDGRDQIDLYYFGPGHTNGDLVVVFPQKRIAYFGDLFPSKAAPVVDRTAGGSAVAFPETLAKAVAQITGVARVVTGHEAGLNTERSKSNVSVDISTPRTMTWSDLQEYADFNREFLAAVKAARAAGKTAEQAAAALRLPDRYHDYDMRQARANVEGIYAELEGK
jgi:glyoxylase-like metal-dependent hydrolase (beta-lactamase superfamily II)